MACSKVELFEYIILANSAEKYSEGAIVAVSSGDIDAGSYSGST